VLAAIERLCQGGTGETTVVMATQDAEAAARFADRIVVLREGRVALSGTTREVLSSVQQMAAWGLDVPQLAHLADRCRAPVVFTPEEAMQAWDGALLEPSRQSPGVPNGRAPEPVIEVRDLCYVYPASDQPALHGVTLDLWRGEWLAMIGVNGSGKTTLLKHLNGLLSPSSGTVLVDGGDTRERQVGDLARTVGYLPQNPDHSIFSATVYEETAFGPRQLGLRGQALDARVADTLDRLHLSAFAQYPPAVLGYGLRRQVALAGVLAMHAPVLALDEPAVGLDRGTIRRLMDAILAQHQHGTTVVMVTHDLQLAARYAQRVVALHRGRLVAQGPTREVLSDVTLIRELGLAPLPVTALAHALDWPRPLPISVDDWRPDG
jgi:energy-coupling factor transport system ATP-binding protein